MYCLLGILGNGLRATEDDAWFHEGEKVEDSAIILLLPIRDITVEREIARCGVSGVKV